MADVFLKWWPVLLVVAQGLLTWAVWSLGRRFLPREEFEAYKTAHGDDHEEIGDQLQAGREQFTRIESDLKHLPTLRHIDELKAQLHAVDKGVVELNGSIKAVAARIGAVENPVRDIVRSALEDNK